ncbi:hypothetical protein ACLOJK_009442 [Asimina triloba]
MLFMEFVTKNYKDLKTLNPKLPILIRECSGVEPQLWARYGLELPVLMKELAEIEQEDEDITLAEVQLLVQETREVGSWTDPRSSTWMIKRSSQFTVRDDDNFGVERCVRLEGLSEAQINQKLEELSKAGAALKS